jgi:hypothetical protein
VREVFGGLDFVSREEFDAVKDMAAAARGSGNAQGTARRAGRRENGLIGQVGRRARSG